MSRNVVVTGLGTITGHGLGIDILWDALLQGKSSIDRIQSFDPSEFDTQIASEVKDFKVNKFVPKSYRKATKVMAIDIGLAVAAADQAVRDANLVTPGTDADQPRTYEGPRMGAHIGAGLISAELNEITEAFSTSNTGDDQLDFHKWGTEGMTHLTPLWLLKYLPNMLACHVTIIHDTQGPSNTITCGEASGGLSIGESTRVIQRGNADICFCGGAESKLPPLTYFRQQLTGLLNTTDNDNPTKAIRPFDQSAAGTVVGEAGGIITLEAEDTANARGASAYARIAGVGAGHTVYPQGEGLLPDPEGKGIERAIKAAFRDAEISPDLIDLIIPYGAGIPDFDNAEAAALKTIFGDNLANIPLWCSKPFIATCGASSSAIDVAIAAKILKEQTIPARINCDNPIDGLNIKTSDAQSADLNYALVISTGVGGQNVAIILQRIND